MALYALRLWILGALAIPGAEESDSFALRGRDPLGLITQRHQDHGIDQKAYMKLPNDKRADGSTSSSQHENKKNEETSLSFAAAVSSFFVFV